MIVSLAARILRGGGRSSVVRLALMTLATAVLVIASLCGAAVASGSSGAQDRSAARQPAYTEPGSTAGFSVRQIDDSVGSRPLTRVLLSKRPETAGGVARAWTPPGCTRFPDPGTACVSPALRALAERRPLLAQRLQLGDAPRTIAAAGLALPDDLIVYQGVRRIGDGLAARADGWGGAPVDDGAASPTTLAIEILLLVGLPALLTVGVCARLSATTRSRRSRALRLMGLSERELGFVAAFEGRIAGLLGAVIAVAAWPLVNAGVARSGAAGFAWFPSDSAIGIVPALAIVVVLPILIGAICRRGATSAGEGPTQRISHRPTSPWRLMPLMLGVLTLSTYIALHAQGLLRGGGGAAATVFAVGTGLSAVGLVVALRPLVERLARWNAGRTSSAAVRIGSRRVESDAAGVVRVVTAAVALVVVAAVSSAVLRDASLAAGPLADTMLVTVDAGPMTPAQRSAVTRLPAQASAVLAQSRPTVAPGGPIPADPGAAELATGVPVVYAWCAELLVLSAPRGTPCIDGRSYRAVDVDSSSFPNPLPVGARVVMSSDPTTDLTVPAATLAFADLGSGVVSPGSVVVTGLPDAVPATAVITAQIGTSDAAIGAYQDDLARVSPAVSARLTGNDVAAIAAYRVHAGVIRYGTGIGLALAMIAFLAAAVDRIRERRRSLAVLVAAGAGARLLRAAQVVEVAVPAIVGLLGAVVVGFLVGTAYLTMGGLQQGLYWAAAGWPMLYAAVSLLVVTAVAAVLRVRVTASLLRRE